MNRKVFLSVLAASAALGICVGWFQQPEDRLTFMSVGQGDATLISSQGVTALIDDGPQTRDGRNTLQAVLRRNHVARVDLILLSHPDSDHTGGTQELLHLFPGVQICISASFRSAPKMEQQIHSWGLQDSQIHWLSRTASISVGNCRLHIYCPRVGLKENDNNGSMFVHLIDEGATATFSGDAPTVVEQQVGTLATWNSDILHVGHHGSRTATGEAWIEDVHPKFAVISCGLGNRFGHPHEVTLRRLQAHRITVLRTDLQGDVVFHPQGGHFVLDP